MAARRRDFARLGTKCFRQHGGKAPSCRYTPRVSSSRFLIFTATLTEQNNCQENRAFFSARKPYNRTSGPSFSRFWQTSDNRTQSYNRVCSILLKIPCFRNPVFHNHTSTSASLLYSPLSTFTMPRHLTPSLNPNGVSPVQNRPEGAAEC